MGKWSSSGTYLEKVRSPTDIAALPERMSDAFTGHESLSVSITGPDGRTLFATTGAAFPQQLINGCSRRRAHAGRPELVTWKQDGQTYHGFATKAPTGAAELPQAVVAVALNFDSAPCVHGSVLRDSLARDRCRHPFHGIVRLACREAWLGPDPRDDPRCTEHYGEPVA